MMKGDKSEQFAVRSFEKVGFSCFQLMCLVIGIEKAERFYSPGCRFNIYFLLLYRNNLLYKIKRTQNFLSGSFYSCLVPPVGVEPTRYHYHRILSPSAQPLSRANEESERHERKRVFRHEGGGRGR